MESKIRARVQNEICLKHVFVAALQRVSVDSLQKLGRQQTGQILSFLRAKLANQALQYRHLRSEVQLHGREKAFSK
jgi:hypothetical protein